MRKHFWKSHTFQFWFLSCFAILMLPMISGFAYYASVQENFKAKSYEVSQMAIEQAANVIDEKFAMLCNVADSVYVSSEIKRIKYLSLPYDAEKYYELHKRASYLTNFTIQYDLFRNLYVYYSDMHCLMDGQRLFTELNQISSVLHNRIGMDEQDFRELTAQMHYNSFHLLEDGTLLFLRTLSTRGIEKEPIITLVATVNTDSLYEVLAQTSENTKGNAYLLNPAGTVLGKYGEDTPLDYDAIINTAPKEQPGNKNPVTVHMQSGISDFLYVLSIPSNAFLLDVTRTRQWFWAINSIALVLGFVFCYAITVRNYRPLHALKQRINTNGQNKDDFALINAKLAELLAEESSMRQEILQMEHIANKRVFRLMLEGRLNELEGNLKDHLRFSGPLFVVAYLYQGENADWLHHGKLTTPEVVLNVFLSDLCTELCEYALQRENEGYAVVFCFVEGTDPIEAQLAVNGICTRLLERITAHISLTSMRAYIGDTQERLQNVHRSWENALRSKEYADFVPHQLSAVVQFDPMMYSSDISWQDYDIMDAERNFINLMLEGSYARAETLLHEILTYYSYTGGMSMYVMRCRMFGVMNMMLNILHEIEPDLTSDDYQEISPVEMLLNARSPGELEKAVFDIIGQLVGAQESKTVDTSSRVEQIQRYIAANYYDVNLSVQMVANAYDMSLPYLSRIFKKEYGSGLLDYINHYRMEKAKEFMRANEEETVASIAAKVGFNSSQTLIRAFKRYENMTPGQYKAAMGVKRTET